jgi:hypothetical protein
MVHCLNIVGHLLDIGPLPGSDRLRLIFQKIIQGSLRAFDKPVHISVSICIGGSGGKGAGMNAA